MGYVLTLSALSSIDYLSLMVSWTLPSPGGPEQTREKWVVNLTQILGTRKLANMSQGGGLEGQLLMISSTSSFHKGNKLQEVSSIGQENKMIQSIMKYEHTSESPYILQPSNW